MFSPHARRLVALAVLVVALEAVCRAHLVRPTDLVPPVLRKVAKVHRLGAFRRLASIYIPSCSREILGGITLGVSYAFVAVIASEFLLAPAGIGHDIADSYMSFKIERMYGLMLALL